MKISEIKHLVVSARQKEKMQKELMQSLSYIRNNVILGRGNNLSSEILMEELAANTDALKPAFQDMEHYLHVYDTDKAEKVLYEYLNTGISKDIGRFLAQWESIPASELLKTIEIYMDSLREEFIEQKRRKDEIISDIVYFPVVLNAMLVLLDFVYVAFFIEQQKLFDQMFF